jgi:hypothetical protein
MKRLQQLPSPAEIRQAVALSKSASFKPDPRACSVCRIQVDPDDLPCTVWSEHDQNDRPRSPPVLVFLGPGKEHEACRKAMADHPRLYVEVDGGPGSWPSLCGPCVHRYSLSCGHKDLKSNGGQGLLITLAGPDTMIVCTRNGGCHRPIRPAVRCEGRIDGALEQKIQANAAERAAIQMRIDELDRQSRELREWESERLVDQEDGA